jgi:hypothetical protein
MPEMPVLAMVRRLVRAGLVLSAERSLEKVVFEKHPPLLRTAKDEEWFSDL